MLRICQNGATRHRSGPSGFVQPIRTRMSSSVERGTLKLWHSDTRAPEQFAQKGVLLAQFLNEVKVFFLTLFELVHACVQAHEILALGSNGGASIGGPKPDEPSYREKKTSYDGSPPRLGLISLVHQEASSLEGLQRAL